jgi:pyrroline-5-carboxylate reductase
MKLSFIGGGNMGEAMLSALISKGIAGKKDITVSEPLESRRQFLAESYGVKVTPENPQAIAAADVIVFAVKPQTLPTVSAELAGRLKPGQLLVSIIAGARIETLRNGLNHKSIVRSMPNTPAQIGEGVTVWTATPKVTAAQKKLAGEILGAMGKEIYVDDERYLDMATAVSGSGPAYLFYFVESFIDAAVAIGWSRDLAKELAMGTVLGAAHLLEKSGKEAADLRRAVTSPSGTTAAAISVLEEGKFTGLMARAIAAAHERAKELGGTKR